MTIQGGDLVALFTGGWLEIAEAGTVPTPPTVSSTNTALDTKMLAKAIKIINKLGKTVIFTMYPAASYDATTGKTTQGDSVSYSKKVIPPYDVELKYVDGDLIKVGDMLSGVAASGIEFTPANGAMVTIDSQVWEIVRVSPVYSGEQVALYLLQLRILMLFNNTAIVQRATNTLNSMGGSVRTYTTRIADLPCRLSTKTLNEVSGNGRIMQTNTYELFCDITDDTMLIDVTDRIVVCRKTLEITGINNAGINNAGQAKSYYQINCTEVI